MTIQLATRVQRIKPSATLTLSARANQLKSQGQDIINLAVGEPDFDTPDFIKQAAIQALHDGFTKYTAVDGIASLKQAIIHKLARENQLNYQPNQIIVSCGIKQALYNLTQALLNDGDEVIIPAPYWVSYPDMVLLAGGIPIIIETNINQQFKITPEQLAAAITPKTRLIIINSPSNPSGMAYTRAELTELAKVLQAHPQVWIATDDMYEHILWSDEAFCNIVNVCPELYERTIVFNGVSKSYAMTGWRIGYAAGDAHLIKAMANIQSQSTSNPNSIAQVAAQAAMEGDQTCIQDMCAAYKLRHEFVYRSLSSIEGIKVEPSVGTFYIFPDISGVLQRLQFADDTALAEFLLQQAGIALLPGSAFGTANCLRLSFATSLEILQQAMQRLKTALA